MRWSLILCLAVVACDSRPSEDAASRAPRMENAEVSFPDLTPFAASRVWKLTKRQPIPVTEALKQVRELRAMNFVEFDVPESEPSVGPDARLDLGLPAMKRVSRMMLPGLVARLRPLWDSKSWSDLETELAKETALACQDHGAPPLSFNMPDSTGNRRNLGRLLEWFRKYAATREGYASMILTMDTGPFQGLPVEPNAKPKKVGETKISDGMVLELGELPDRDEPWVLTLRRDGKVAWQRIASMAPGSKLEQLKLSDTPPTRVGSYGWKVHLSMAGEYVHLYLGPSGECLFYFCSW